MQPAPSIRDQKSQLRSDALAPRCHAGCRARGGHETVVQRPLILKRGVIVSGYSPMKSEFNPVPLMRKLADVAGHRPKICGCGYAEAHRQIYGFHMLGQPADAR